MRARVKIEYIRSFMAHLNVLALYSTFKFANFRGYDRARHAGKKWRGEIDHPWERGRVAMVSKGLKLKAMYAGCPVNLVCNL